MEANFRPASGNSQDTPSYGRIDHYSIRNAHFGGLWVDLDFGIDQATGKWTEGYAGCKTSGFSNRANKENHIARWPIAMHDVTRKPISRERGEKWWQSTKARMRKREGGKYFV